MAEAINLIAAVNGVLERWTMQPENDIEEYDPILRSHPQVSGYRLIARRGRGGVAEVWEAESPGGHRVALKLVHVSTDLRSGELRALKITRGIRHPGLVVVHGAWQVENLLVISMELADRSIWDRFLEANVEGLRGIRRGELLGYLDPVADAIDYLNGPWHTIEGRQGVGIQHRDLKPQNLLLLGDRAKVADFGMARVIEGCVTGHSGPCTVPYAAPEYFGGKTSRQSDQYALAVTYCQLRGGRIPFHGTTAQIAVGHMCNEPDLNGLPEPERPIMARALAKRPDDRWPDCRSFLDALKAIGSAGERAIPDALPRDRRGPSSERDGAVKSSAVGLDSADTDFIPVDSGELETPYDSVGSAYLVAGFQSRRDGFGTVRQVGTSILGHLMGWSSRLGRMLPLVASRLNRLRLIRDRAADGGWSRSRSVRIVSIAALVALGLVVCELVWTFAAPQRRPERIGIAVATETAPGQTKIRARTGSHRTGITPAPTRQPRIIGADRDARAVPVRRASPETALRTLVDSPKRERVVAATPRAATGPEESTPTTRLGAVERPNPPPAENGSKLGLESVMAWLERSDLFRLLSIAASPASRRSGAKLRSVGNDRLDGTERNSGRLVSDHSAKRKVGFTTGSEQGEAATRLNVLPPTPAALAYKRGLAAFCVGSFDRSIADFTEVIRLDPESFEARLRRGISYSVVGRAQEALADYSAAIQLEPSKPDAYMERARVYANLGEKNLAVSDYTEAIRLRPEARAYLARGGIHHEMGSYDQALADCDRALRLRPSDSAALYLRGLTHYHSGAYAGAIADFTALIRLDPKNARAYRARGEAHARAGKSAEARVDHETFERLSRPSGDGVSNGLAVPSG